MGKYAERVFDGMALLDKENPGWELKIDLEELNLASGCHCVLGQLYQAQCEGTNWPTGFDWANHNLVSCPTNYGFDIMSCDDDRDTVDNEYGQLEEEWIAAIKGRLDRGIQV
jgi:hypothetical protein